MTKKALERQIESLERQLEEAKQSHSRAISEKSREMRRVSRDSWVNLRGTFGPLNDLVDQLLKAHDAASPLRSAVPSNSGHGVADPTGNGVGNPDRTRVESINRKLGELAHWIADSMSDRGPLEGYRPQCWNPDCPGRGLFQKFDADLCEHCGSDFTEHRYKPVYLKERRRCRLRDCEGRDRVGACEHSA